MTPGSIPGTGTHIVFFSFFSLLIITFPLFYLFSSSSFFFFSSMGNYQSPLKRAFEGGFNGDAADSIEFCVVNCIANRSAKSFSRRESEKNQQAAEISAGTGYSLSITCVHHAVPKVPPGSIPGTGTHIFFSFSFLYNFSFFFFFFLHWYCGFCVQPRSSLAQ